MLTDISIVSENAISIERGYEVAVKIIAMGVRKWVILHFPAGALAVNAAGERVFQPGLQLQPESIAGAVGAGDAFAAGVLMGVHAGNPIKDCLRLGVCAAASSLFKATSSDGILSADACLELAVKYGYRKGWVEKVSA